MPRDMGSIGAFSGRGSGSEQSRQAGLPFSGIPPELAKGVTGIIAREPEDDHVDVSFEQTEKAASPFTLRTLFTPHYPALGLAFVLVMAQTAAMQIGPLLTQIGIDKGIVQSNIKVLVWVSLAYLFAILLNSITGYARIAWTGRLGERLMMTLRIRVFSHIQRLSLDFFTEEMSGRIMTRMTSDIEALTNLLQDGIINLMVQALTMIFVIGVLFTLNAKLAIILITVVLPAMLILTLWFRKVSDAGYGVVRDRIATLLADFQENLNGIRVVHAFYRQKQNIAHHLRLAGEYAQANYYTAKAGAMFDSGSTVIAVFGQALILLIGGNMVLKGTLTIGELTAFLLYLTSFFAPIQQLVQLYNTYQQGQAAVTKLRDLLSLKPSVPESQTAKDLPCIEGEIDLYGVNFSYNSGKPVLSDIHLNIRPGETIAFVGETGAGKSTLAKLIMRFYDPSPGCISMDGHDLKDVTFKSLRTQLGYVPQEPFLFGGTLRDNVAFSNPEAGDDEVWEACRAVGIEDLVKKMPNAIHTVIHERGSSLSSGERQLIALARAFLAKPRVVVLDEATSNLDLASESRIELALDALLQGRTAVIIAHRLNTAMRADRIAVFDHGRLVELGCHDELLANHGPYARMYEKWMKQSH
ncbi:MAG: ABC transporter ATP-binding protein/permease [Desulfobacteraceae bacterium]|nr:ABC transporter ATP-binding protein/permease [Desulfobacteraceae bacterium]